MTIDEAINILTIEQDAHHSYATDVVGQAEKLGIEALKREKQWRENPRWGLPPLLPGETE